MRKVFFPYSASTLLEKKKNARIDPRTVAKLNFELKKFAGPQKLPTITATVLRGVLDDKVTKKDAGGNYFGFSSARHSGGVVIGQMRRLQNGWPIAVQALFDVEDAANGPFNTLVLGFCTAEEQYGPLLVSYHSIMELSTEAFRKYEKIAYPSLDDAKVMATACSELIAGVITDDNCGISNFSNAKMNGSQNFLYFDPGIKPGRRAVQRNSDSSGSGTVVQESGRPTVVGETPTHKRKSALPKSKKNSAATTLQQSVPVINVEEPEPITKRPRASVTRAEETTPTSQRPQPQSSQFETELAVLKAKSEASKALHDAQVELARRTETVMRLEDLRERDDAARDESIRDRIRQESERDAYESKLATAQRATLEAVMRSHKEAQIREDAERKDATKALADSNRGALAIAERVNAQHFEHTLALQSGKAALAQAPAISKEDSFKVFLDRIGYTEHFDLLWNAGVKSAKAIAALPEKHLMDLGLTNIEVYLLKNEATEE